jgi:hypothetical protein
MGRAVRLVANVAIFARVSRLLRLVVESQVIFCARCQRHWSLPGPLTFYEKRALEKHPCPHCGTSALCCQKRAKPPSGSDGAAAYQKILAR